MLTQIAAKILNLFPESQIQYQWVKGLRQGVTGGPYPKIKIFYKIMFPRLIQKYFI